MPVHGHSPLVLDSSQLSLQHVLNVIEIVGSFSGLKINTTKTKLIWIGKKKHCGEQINVTYHLDWNITQFQLLGVQFSVNLNEVPDLNYNKAMSDLYKIVNQWGKRDLTPLGKITIIKTFLFTKFNHLFYPYHLLVKN